MNEGQRTFLAAGEEAGCRYLLSTPRRLPTGAGGLHLGHRGGSSLEFRDHREYQPGDDPRRIDWNAYGRTDRLIIKLYREEVSPHVDIVIDGSRSMALEETGKLGATVGMAALIASAASNGSFSHCAWLARDSCIRIQGGSDRPLAWRRLEFDFSGDVSESITRTRPAWRRQGIRVLLSDLLWLADPLLVLQSLSRDASSVIVIQILAEADVNPSIQGNVRLVDSETREVREIFADAPALARYKQAVERHQQNWRKACTQVGAQIATLVAEKLLRDWRPDELVAAGILRAN